METLLSGPQSLATESAGAQAWPVQQTVIPAIRPDGSLFPIGKMDAHITGTLHVAISAFVFCGDALLIQRRAASKYHCGSLWANTCCSHPHWGETAAPAARRRLHEELGLSLELTATGIIDYRTDVTGGLIEHERVHVFKGEVDRRSIVLLPDPAEVSGTRWATRAQLERELRERPETLAPWFRIYIERWDELGL